MNHNYYVPDFELTPNPSPSTRPPPTNKSAASAPTSTTEEEEDMMELLWQDGHVVFQSQNQRSQRKPNIIINGDDAINIMPPKQIPQAENLFMQEDEMANWLHYPLDDTPPPLPPFDHHHHHHHDFLYPPPNSSSLPISNFTHFSRYRGINTTHEQGGPSVSISNQPPTPTVVDSSDTPAAKPPQSRISHTIAPLGISSSDLGTCDFTVSSSPSDSVSVEPTTPKPSPPPAMEDRKRKGRATADDDGDCHQINQGIDVNNYSDVKKRSTKKSRAAEVHNLSERKRRDRINEKMKALQELIPRCNKSDKASMLDEAIEYLKSLQLQVQMMSMGCTVVPMMFPGIQHYMPTVGMGMGMGIGPGMGMTRPMMQFPHVHPESSVQGQSSTSHMAPRFPTSAFPLPPPGAAIPDSNRIQATNLPDSMMNSSATQNLSHPQMQNVVVDPYQQYYLNTNQSRMSMFPQNPSVMQHNTSEPGGSGSSSNHRNLQSG